MSARHVYMVSYDVRQARRLRRVHRLMKRYGMWAQYSVFRCVLGPWDLHRLLEALGDEIDPQADQVFVMDLGPEDGRGHGALRVLGQPLAPYQEGPVVL